MGSLKRQYAQRQNAIYSVSLLIKSLFATVASLAREPVAVNMIE